MEQTTPYICIFKYTNLASRDFFFHLLKYTIIHITIIIITIKEKKIACKATLNIIMIDEKNINHYYDWHKQKKFKSAYALKGMPIN